MIQKIHINNVELSFKSSGEGSDVVLLHGFPSNMFMWESIKNKLIKMHKRVTVVEQRGYPLSYLNNPTISDFSIEKLSNDIEGIIQNLNLTNNLTLVGHDWGSVVAWAILKRGNVNIKNYISICGGDSFPPTSIYRNISFSDGEHYISSFQNPQNSSLKIEDNIQNFIKGAYRTKNRIKNYNLSMYSLFLDNNHTEYAIKDAHINNLSQYFKNSSMYAPLCWYANIDNNILLSNEWNMNEVKSTVKFIFGHDDLAVKLNAKMKNRLKGLADAVQIIEVKNAGHWLPLTHEESVLNEI